MEKNKIVIKIILFIVIIVCLLLITNVVWGKGSAGGGNYIPPEEDKPEQDEQHYEHFSLGNIMQQADDFISKGGRLEESINERNLINVSNDMYKMLLIIAIIVAVIVGAILGIKFIIAGAEGKAEIKEAIVPYVVGCIIVFSAFTIWSVTYNILERISRDK